jgi:hypothetical protein
MLPSHSSRWSSASMCVYMTPRRANSLYTPSRLSLTRNGRGSAPAAAKAQISWASKIAEARDDLKLFRPGDYPLIPGTALQIGERHAFLWTAGYGPRLDTLIGPETPNPNPISVKVLRGNCSLHASGCLERRACANQDQLQLVPSQRPPACDTPICQCGGDSTDGQRAEVAFQVYI